MPEFKLTIKVETNLPLSDEEKNEVFHNILSRLQGYQTTPPESLLGAEISMKMEDDAE
jgi:hypothetical protein